MIKPILKADLEKERLGPAVGGLFHHGDQGVFCRECRSSKYLHPANTESNLPLCNHPTNKTLAKASDFVSKTDYVVYVSHATWRNNDGRCAQFTPSLWTRIKRIVGCAKSRW
jgi:hypothetical protein